MGNQSALEEMVTVASPSDRAAFWHNKRVFITGHTGFKGSWLALWLQQWGADVYGYSLPPENPSLFMQAKLEQKIPGQFADIRDYAALSKAMTQYRPNIVFHLAAQPLVRTSYEDPITTYATNVLGTVHVLEAVRHTKSVQAAIVVTSDKCYENNDHPAAFKEEDRLGGHDPYSNSKACAELLSQSYRDSYFSIGDGPLLATARAGNVIGGGDWAKDRLIPDAIRAFTTETPLVIRYPQATRPWQHVLEAVNGYLVLAEALMTNGKTYAEAWNFGPEPEAFRSVEDVVQKLTAEWGPKAAYKCEPTPNWKEADTLALDINKAKQRLGWKPKLALQQAIAITAAWYKAQLDGGDMQQVTLNQIKSYLAL